MIPDSFLMRGKITLYLVQHISKYKVFNPIWINFPSLDESAWSQLKAYALCPGRKRGFQVFQVSKKGEKERKKGEYLKIKELPLARKIRPQSAGSKLENLSPT
jgi:hypothetical protein